jgi:hypothetical protein
MVTHTCTLRYLVVEIGRITVQEQPGQKVLEISSQLIKIWTWCHAPVIPAVARWVVYYHSGVELRASFLLVRLSTT